MNYVIKSNLIHSPPVKEARVERSLPTTVDRVAVSTPWDLESTPRTLAAITLGVFGPRAAAEREAPSTPRATI